MNFDHLSWLKETFITVLNQTEPFEEIITIHISISFVADAINIKILWKSQTQVRTLKEFLAQLTISHREPKSESQRFPCSVIMDDEVTQAVEKVIQEWEETFSSIKNNVKAIGAFGTSVDGMTKEENSHQRLNGLVQDGLALLRSLQFRLDLLAQQLLTEEQVQSAQSTLKSWKDQYQSLHLGLRNANLQARTNMRKAAQTKRELLLGGGEESTIRRRNLQTKAGMTNASESITESLRRTRQLMVQEVERTENSLATFDESTGVLKKAESEYKGHRSLLMRTKNLLSAMRRQDVLDRLILLVGFFLFSCAVFYVISKRIGLLKLQRKVTEAIKAGMIVPGDLGAGVAENGFNGVRIDGHGVPNVEVPPLEMHDEL